MDVDDFSLDSLFSDMPKVNRLGFFTSSSLDLEPDYKEVLQMLNELAKSEEPYIDEEGYEWQIVSSIIDEKNCRLAWVEWREKQRGNFLQDNYYLKARDDTSTLMMWEIETYNPYFGCRVRYLNWVKEAVIIIYEDKHDTYIASLRNGSEVKRLEITSDWEMKEYVLAYKKQGQERPEMLRLPSLEGVGEEA